MAEENKRPGQRWERLRDPYRLVIFNDETLEEVGSYKLTLLNVYTLLSTLIVGITIAVFLMVAFTPLRYLMPGYMGNSREALNELNREVDSLRVMVEAQERYNEGFRRMLNGDPQTTPSERPSSRDQQQAVVIARSEEDEKIRKELESKSRTIPDNAKGERPQKALNISPRNIQLGDMRFTTPISGTVVSTFNPKNDHVGVDIVAPKNTPVKAVMDGWVISSDWTLKTGHTIAIQHSNDLVSFYKHNSALLKRAGSYVRAGEAIAIIGNSGELTDGPHLHFELWHQGTPIDPLSYVRFP
jgi:murein DD-endopeptidase MepM/ murein hydrolase activator NlpD